MDGAWMRAFDHEKWEVGGGVQGGGGVQVVEGEEEDGV